jgi:hypothetical protein
MSNKCRLLRNTIIRGLLLSLTLLAPALANPGWAGDSSLLVGVEVGSFLKPAAKVDFWVPGSYGSGFFRDLVMGAAAGPHGAEASIGAGATCSDGDHHADLRGIVSRYRGQTSVGAEFTPYMTLTRVGWVRFGVGAVHTFGEPTPLHFRWSVGLLLPLK